MSGKLTRTQYGTGDASLVCDGGRLCHRPEFTKSVGETRKSGCCRKRINPSRGQMSCGTVSQKRQVLGLRINFHMYGQIGAVGSLREKVAVAGTARINSSQGQC